MTLICLLLPLMMSQPTTQNVQQPPAMVGQGVGRPSPRHAPAQARLMARRAAEVRAVHSLGLQATGQQSFFIRGFQYQYHGVRPDGSVVVTATFRRTTF